MHPRPASAITAGTTAPVSAAAPLSSAGATAGPMQSTPASGKNLAIARKVARLLDITINSGLRDLVAYVDEAVPTIFDPVATAAGGTAVDGAGSSSSVTAAAATASGGGGSGGPEAAKRAASPIASTVSTATATVTPNPAAASAGLRSALESRVAETHKDFLSQLRTLNDIFQEVSRHVQDLDKECTILEDALGMGPATSSSTSTGTARAPGSSSSAEAEALLRHVTALQRDLERAQRRQLDVKEFREKFNFGAAEQRILEEGPVDARYLDVLEQARAVHRHSKSLLTTREYQQNAGAVIESTYIAIARATEKISRFLLALSTSPSPGGAGGGRSGGRGSDGTGLVSSVAADVPEVSSLYLRCARVLREESLVQWEKVMEELARVRRASVLRRYFHLLTTGSATTSAGTYRAGASTRADGTSTAGASSSSALRPLEAELGDPVFFFSSLFAWLHQCIVEEDDFLNLFFSDAPASEVATAAVATAKTDALDSTPSSSPVTVTLASSPASTLSRRALLSLIFDGIAKHVRTALDSVLDRFVKASAVLGHTISTSSAANDTDSDGHSTMADGSTASRERSVVGNRIHSSHDNPAARHRGPRGLTGGIARLLYAATGRQIAPDGSTSNTAGGGLGGNEAILQRYANVHSRTQQVAVVASLMRGSLSGLHVCCQLLQLFAYHGASTLIPLLGAKASLTQLVVESAQVELQRVLQQLVKFISLHLFDSVGGIVYRLPVLRRLSIAFETTLQGRATAKNATAATAATITTVTGVTATANATDTIAADAPPRRFVLDFLFRHHTLLSGEALDDSFAGKSELSITIGGGGGGLLKSPATLTSVPVSGSSTSGTTDPQQQASALELWRALQHLILPATPEVQASLKVLAQLLTDTARQQQLLAAIREQHRQQRERNNKRCTNQGSKVSGKDAEDCERDADEALEERVDAEPPMYCMAVIQSLLGLPVLLSAQPTANAGLDDPCQATLILNCFAALRAVLAEKESVLKMCLPARTNASAAGAEAGSSTSALLAIVDAESARLEASLSTHIAGAACQHYFGQARLPAAVRQEIKEECGSIQEQTAEVTTRLFAQKQQAVRTALYWLYNFYSLMASSGTLPPLPLISSLTDAAAQCRLQTAVSQQVVAEYAAIYETVARLVTVADGAVPALLSVEETAALDDMAPEKLRILMG